MYGAKKETMIPLKLQIKNFLSYGADITTIDFSPYHLVCLSGKNGHGKSALLDAITWAIWGQARKVSGVVKADHGLLRLGQTHMLVILDFICNDTHYRVRREFSLSYGKPYAAIDFGIINEDSETIIPLTEKTIRATQKKIEQTIHLDYESFINSAFLRQGQANEFSKKSPKDRKEILANILGLQRFEKLRKAAQDKVRQAQAMKQLIQSRQEKIEQELAQADQIKAQMLATQKSLETIIQREHANQKEQKEIQATRHRLTKQQHEKAQVQKEGKALGQHQQKLQQELRSIVATWRSILKKLLVMQPIEIFKKEKEQAQLTCTRMQEALQKKLEKKELYLKKQEAANKIEQELRKKQLTQLQEHTLKCQKTELEQKNAAQTIRTIEEQLTTMQKECKAIEAEIKAHKKNLSKEHDQKIKKLEQQFEKRRTHYQQWIAQANWAKKELEAIDHKKRMVHDDTSPSCPLCEQNLTASRKKFLRNKLTKNVSFFMHRYNRLSTLIGLLKPLLVDQHAHISTLKKEQEDQRHAQHVCTELEKKRGALQQHIVTLNKQYKTCQDHLKVGKTTLAALQKQMQALEKKAEQQVLDEPTYKQKLLQLRTIKKEYEAICYDQKEHQAAQKRIHEIEAQLASYETIQKEAALQHERKKQVASLCTQLREIKKQRASQEKQLKAFEHLKQEEQQCKHKEDELTKTVAALTKEKEAILQEKGKLEQQQVMLEKLKKEHLQQAKEIKKNDLEIGDYQTIANAMSKNGIQALLIEDAIPEIEQEANQLLARLTDNQAQIFIESLRDLKSGGTKETLDIKISDAAGIRPYEMFSGGEAFRIDFALRIAISKLLARRAGISLQTLIIDEGFGSQDEEGLSYIMDVIYKIQDDFKKVIIVSHLPLLKDQFPIHFYVQKGPQGSHVNVIEQA